MRKKSKNAKIVSFSLSKEEISLVERFTRELQFKSQSEFIGWLIKNYNAKQDISEELEKIRNKKECLQKKLKKLQEREKELIETLKMQQKIKQEREKELKAKAIEIIRRKIKEGADNFEIEDIARYWAFKLNTTIEELIYKAKLNI